MQRHPGRPAAPHELMTGQPSGLDPQTHNVFGQPVKPRPYVLPPGPPTQQQPARSTLRPGVAVPYAVTTTEEIVVRRTTTTSYLVPVCYPAVVPVDPLTTSGSIAGAYPSPERPAVRATMPSPVVHTPPGRQRVDPRAVRALVISLTIVSLGVTLLVLALLLG